VVRKAPLYRRPALPVVVGDVINGSTISVQRYLEDSRDWRRLSPTDIAGFFSDLRVALEPSRTPRLYPTPFRRDREAVQQQEGLFAAIAVGTLQALSERSYWAPAADDAHAVECRDMRVPMSRLFASTPSIPSSPSPAPSELGPVAPSQPDLTVSADLPVLEACQKLAAGQLGGTPPHVALVRFVAAGDARWLTPALGDCREAQLCLRTSFLQALQEMPRHIHAQPTAALQAGGVVHTSDVTVLRGPLESGAEWIANAPRLDIISAALPRSPRCDDQGQYAYIGDKAAVLETLERVFAVAIASGVDVLVIPPPGVGGVGGCAHPAADSGDLLRKVIWEHAEHLPKVWVCQEYLGQLRPAAWSTFAAALKRGREPLEYPGLVSIAASPYVRPSAWNPQKRLSASTPRGMRTARGVLGATAPAVLRSVRAS